MKISQYNIIKENDENILVYNAYRKSSIYLDKGSSTLAFEDINEFDKLDDATKKVLIDNGFVVDDSRNEYDEIKYIYEQHYFDNSFFNIILVPSLSCNFKCPYCFEKDYSCGKENIKKYFKALKEYAKKHFHLHNIVQVSMFGGEPLLFYKEFIEFLDFVKQDASEHNYRYITSIVTNGSLLDAEKFKRLLDHNLLSLQITIDSDKENHDINRIFRNGKPSFDLLVSKINDLLPISYKYDDFKFILRINLNNTTVERVKNSLSYINVDVRGHINLMIRAIYNTHAYKENNTNNVNELKDYCDMGRDLGFIISKEKFNYQTCESCGDRKNFVLMPDLTVWKCINDLAVKDASFGRVDEDGNLELEPDKIVNWYKHAMSAFVDTDCINCKMLPDCLGGCILYKIKNKVKCCRTFDMFSLPFTY